MITNQCDGCKRKWPMDVRGNHFDPASGRLFMVCTTLERGIYIRSEAERALHKASCPCFKSMPDSWCSCGVVNQLEWADTHISSAQLADARSISEEGYRWIVITVDEGLYLGRTLVEAIGAARIGETG